MLERIGLVFEIATIIVCIHQLYGKKLKCDISTILLFLLMTFYLEIINYIGVDNTFSFLVHVFALLYCLHKFKESLLKTIISVFLYIIVIGIIQFMALLLAALTFPNNEALRIFLGSLLTLGTTIWILPHLKICVFRNAIFKRNMLTHFIFVFICIIMIIMLLQSRIIEQVSMDTFIFTMPAIILIIVLVIRWDVTSSSEELAKKELQTILANQDNHEELITKVRINQHGIKNHLLTMISTPYAYRSYEKIVNAQKQYYGKIDKESFFDKLILLENNTIEGFLYGKLNEAQSYGIDVVYKIYCKLPSSIISDYYLVEILGILIDNAIEAVKCDMTPQMAIYFEERNNKYIISVRNKYRVVAYSEIESWFELGKSEKRNDGNYGIGLYRLKQLSTELNFKICPTNIAENNENWLVFDIIFDE